MEGGVGGQLTVHGDVFPLPGEHPALGSDLVCGGGGGDTGGRGGLTWQVH